MTTNNQNNKLGRGLSALLGDDVSFLKEVPVSSEKKETKNNNDVFYVSPADKEGTANEIVMLAMGCIELNPYQPRTHFNIESIKELAQSIEKKGLLQPIVVRPTQDIHKFQIISGERRFRAIKSLGHTSIPVVIRQATDLEMLELGLAENLQREDLNPIEEAKGYKRLIDEFGYTQEQLSSIVHKSRPYIANVIRLLKLPENILKEIESGRISRSHARTLIKEENPEKVLEKIIKNKLSVRSAEEEHKKSSKKLKKENVKSANQNTEIIAIQDLLIHTFKTKVSVDLDKNKSGKITIHFSDLQELDRILGLLTCVYDKDTTPPKFTKPY